MSPHEILRPGYLAEPLTYCNTRESRPYTWLRQHSRAGSDGESASEPDGIHESRRAAPVL